jgi:hypothetical protein
MIMGTKSAGLSLTDTRDSTFFYTYFSQRNMFLYPFGPAKQAVTLSSNSVTACFKQRCHSRKMFIQKKLASEWLLPSERKYRWVSNGAYRSWALTVLRRLAWVRAIAASNMQ